MYAPAGDHKGIGQAREDHHVHSMQKAAVCVPSVCSGRLSMCTRECLGGLSSESNIGSPPLDRAPGLGNPGAASRAGTEQKSQGEHKKPDDGILATDHNHAGKAAEGHERGRGTHGHPPAILPGPPQLTGFKGLDTELHMEDAEAILWAQEEVAKGPAQDSDEATKEKYNVLLTKIMNKF